MQKPERSRDLPLNEAEFERGTFSEMISIPQLIAGIPNFPRRKNAKIRFIRSDEAQPASRNDTGKKHKLLMITHLSVL